MHGPHLHLEEDITVPDAGQSRTWPRGRGKVARASHSARSYKVAGVLSSVGVLKDQSGRAGALRSEVECSPSMEPRQARSSHERINTGQG